MYIRRSTATGYLLRHFAFACAYCVKPKPANPGIRHTAAFKPKQTSLDIHTPRLPQVVDSLTYTLKNIHRRHHRTLPPTHIHNHTLVTMYFSSPTSNITPALVSTAMTRSDSRDSSTSTCSFTSTPAMQVSYSTSPSTYRSSSSSSTRGAMSISSSSSSTGWLPSPYRSCMLHSSSSSQGYNPSTSSYISDDDLLALDDLAMPPIEYISSPTSAPRQPQREMTTEEQIAMLREMQEREQEHASAKSKAQQQRTVRFAAEQKKTRRVSGASQRRSTTPRRV